MNRVDVLMSGLDRAIPTGGSSNYKVEKWRTVAEKLDEALLEYELDQNSDIEPRIIHVLASNDGLLPNEMAREIVKEIARSRNAV